MNRRCLPVFLVAAVLALGSSLAWAQSPERTVVAAELAASQAQVAALNARLDDVEAYLKNTPPKALSGVPGPGHNGWMMMSAALVLFMSLPGLALFYGGLVRRKNVLSVLAQCLACAGGVIVLWWAFGYSFAFSSGSPWLGDLKFAWLSGVTAAPNADYSPWVSHSVFAMYQLMFAIITPALIVGAIAERMKFSAIMAFLFGWMLLVYFPFAHMFWGVDGFMNGVWNAKAGIKGIDFAGGIVVHMTSGWSALALCLIVGKRTGFGRVAMMPHSLVLTMVGTGMLWFGWYGFNAGSAVAADGVAANAFMTTTLSAGVATVVWTAVEWLHRGKPTVLGMCSGAIGGLAVITPGAGFVSASSAVIIGVVAALVPYFAVMKLKGVLGYDDALDTFGIHGVGGTIGSLLAAVFATSEVNPNLATNLGALINHGLWVEQVKAMAITAVWSVLATVVLAYAIKALIGLRPDEDTEEQGLDQFDHGEVGYHAEA
ncbi:MAG: ammonium transporter [Deltaproteobacteria bacterium]|nr:ammonium transporter [Deltaproteobacteria bacterium]